MTGNTPSKIAKREKNKAKRYSLRQIGLGLLIARKSSLLLHCTAYPSNLHDSKLFEPVMDEMFDIVCKLHWTKERLTVVIDKGMNAESNYSWIDDHARIHFVTTYSTYFAQELAATPLDHFEPPDIPRNRLLIEDEKSEECLLAYRTSGVYWGKERTVVVTHNPATARKKGYTFSSKLETIRQELLSMQTKVRDQLPQWRKANTIKERYLALCGRLHMPAELFELTSSESKNGLTMNFRKNAYLVSRRQVPFEKNITITDNTDWTTEDIVQASLER